MRRNLSRGVMLIQKFAEKYTNVILQKLNIKPKKTIDKRKKKKKKNTKKTNNKVFQFIKQKQDEDEQYKKEKQKKIDEYLMNQEKELDFQQNYSFCNKIFFNETDNFFCNSDEEKTPNILKEKPFTREEETFGEQTGNVSVDTEVGSLNPFHFKFHLENDKNREENIFLFQNDDQFNKHKKKQKVKQEEEEQIENKPEPEWLPENYVWYLAEKEENKPVGDIQFSENQNSRVEEKSLLSGNIFHDVKIYEENQTHEIETNKRKRKLEVKLENELKLDTNLKNNKKGNVSGNRIILNNIEKTDIIENNETKITRNNNINNNNNHNHNNINNNNDNDNIRNKSADIHCANANGIKINDLNEKSEISHCDNNQNKLGSSNKKYNLVFENYNFENLIESPEKNDMETEKIQKHEKEKDDENKEYGTNAKEHETKEQTIVENQNKQGTFDSLFDSYNEVQIIGDNIKKNTAKNDNTNQEFVMKEYKDDFALFDDLNQDTSLELFFIDSQDPPSIFKT